MYRLVGNTPLGEERPETRDMNRTLQQTVDQLVQNMEQIPSPKGL